MYETMDNNRVQHHETDNSFDGMKSRTINRGGLGHAGMSWDARLEERVILSRIEADVPTHPGLSHTTRFTVTTKQRENLAQQKKYKAARATWPWVPILPASRPRVVQLQQQRV